MDTFLRLIVSVLLVALAVGSAASPGSTSENAVSLRPQIEVVGASPAQERLVSDTVALFAAANLRLPDVVIEFQESSEGCHGHAGLFVPAADGPHRVAICGRMAMLVRHELGHAWARHQLSDEDRTRLLDHWELDRWNDARDEWGDRGGEMVAQTIAFGLGLSEPTDDPNVLRYVCSYEVVTGEPAPTAVQESCEAGISSARA